MNLGEKFPVSPGKVEALLARMAALGIDAGLIEESFVRGGGPGGQKINKTASCVQLRYPPLDLVVRCQRERRRSLNRFLALRELVDEIEIRVSPSTSQRLQEIERRRRSKSRARRRSKAKHQGPDPSAAPSPPPGATPSSAGALPPG
ncbi:MAG TPA: peptide chain release factor-like protein [Planctomycetota bacterium]|nr:peptide chain release factor-like protein [Planctomycetota bacterium]